MQPTCVHHATVAEMVNVVSPPHAFFAQKPNALSGGPMLSQTLGRRIDYVAIELCFRAPRGRARLLVSLR